MAGRTTRSWAVALTLFCACLGPLEGPGSAAAQAGSDIERARELFAQGVSHMDAQRYDEAADAFRQTLELHESPQVRFNLGTALHELGALGEAAEQFEIVKDDRHAPRALRREARRLSREIAPHLGHLTIDVEGDVAGTELTLDGRPIGAEQLGAPIAVGEGRHVIEARSGERTGSRSVDVAAGGTASVTLRIPAAVAVHREAHVLDTTPASTAPVEPDTGGGVVSRWWFWTIIGAVVVGAVVVGALAAQPPEPDPIRGNLNPPVLEVRP